IPIPRDNGPARVLEPACRLLDGDMGVIPSFPSALLLALVSSYGETGRGIGDTKGATAVRRSTGPKPSELESFLQMNSEEQFDLEAINSVNSNALVDEARGDKRVLREIVRTAEALLPRVRAETEDPLLVGAILRNKTLDWYRNSPSDAAWLDHVPLRWGGILHEVMVPGGGLGQRAHS